MDNICLGFSHGFLMPQTRIRYLLSFTTESLRKKVFSIFLEKKIGPPSMSNSIITTDPRVTLILRIIILWILKILKKKKIKSLK